MAAKKKLGQSFGSKDFDAEFEKFMNEPLSDESHTVTSPRQNTRVNRLEKSATQESLENIYTDEFSTTFTESKSPSPAEKKRYGDASDDDHSKAESKQGNSVKASVSESDMRERGQESYMTAETGDYDSTLPPPDNDTLHHSRNFPERSYDGMDTLEELADKERFFNKLAVDVSGTLDFAKLNQALDEIPSDQEKSDDIETGLARESLTQKEDAAEEAVARPEEPLISQDNVISGTEGKRSEKEDEEDSERLSIKSEFDDGADYKTVEKGSTPDESQHLSVDDSDSPPSESLRSIKEIAKSRMREVKERSKEKVNTSQKESKGNKNASKLPRPFSGSRERKDSWSMAQSKEIRRGSASQRSSSARSSAKSSANGDSSTKSVASQEYSKSHGNTKTFSTRHLQSSEGPAKASGEISQFSKAKRSPVDYERELPTQKVADMSRELQLQNELYELRADYGRVLDENEKVRGELERISKSMNKNDMKVRYEYELDQSNLKIANLEKQLRKAKELRLKKDDSEDEIEDKASREIAQLKKELKEQELLLNGYQLENERLFKEVKRRDIERKELQSTLVEENQRLKNALTESEARRENLETQLRDSQKEAYDRRSMELDKDEGSKRILHSLQEENESLRLEIVTSKEKIDKDGKVIKDLERQISEMEKIVKKRYPDSVPNMLGDQKRSDTNTEQQRFVNHSKTMEFLEKKLNRLEKELDMKDEEASQLLAASESRFRKMSESYDKHIDGLQKQMSKVMAKQKREKSRKSPDGKGISANVESNGRDDTVRTPSATQDGRKNYKTNRRRDPILENVDDDGIQRLKSERASSPIVLPDSSHVASLQVENAQLKLKLDDLRVSFEELRVKDIAELSKMEACLAKTEARLTKAEAEVAKAEIESGRIRAKAEADVEDIKRVRDREIEMAKASQIKFEEIISKWQDDCGKLEKKLMDYDLVTDRLKEKSIELTVDKELLQAARLKEDVLQNQIRLLQKQLKDAIDCQPPSQQRINNIEVQLTGMQQRQLERENEIRNLARAAQPRFQLDRDLSEVEWGRIVEAKDAQIKQFRDELDDILQTLHGLYAARSFGYEEGMTHVPHSKLR